MTEDKPINILDHFKEIKKRLIRYFIFLGILFYFKIPQKVKEVLDQNILNIKNQISEAEKLKEDAKIF